MEEKKITTKDVKQLDWEEWQSFLRKFEDCTCAPGSALACPSCREYNRLKYGDSIPYRGE